MSWSLKNILLSLNIYRRPWKFLNYTRTVKLAFVQCECHTSRESVIATLKSINRNRDAGFRFSNIFWFLDPIYMGKKRVLPSLRTPMKVVHRIYWKTKCPLKIFKWSGKPTVDVSAWLTSPIFLGEGLVPWRKHYTWDRILSHIAQGTRPWVRKDRFAVFESFRFVNLQRRSSGLSAFALPILLFCFMLLVNTT